MTSSTSPPAELRRRLSVAQEDPGRRAEGRLARGLPVAGDLSRPSRHDPRGARPADARRVRRERRSRADERPGRIAACRSTRSSRWPRSSSARRSSTRRSRSSPGSTPTGSTRRSCRSACSSPTRRSSTSTTRSSSPRSRSRTGPQYVFWAPIKGGLTDEALPPELAGYNTYTSKGLPPGPICTPTATSIDAALDPDTKDGYLYFIAKGDGTKTSAFAKTLKEHQANVKKYLKP